jgi:hypothetical protein
VPCFCYQVVSVLGMLQFLPLGVASCCASIQLVPCDSVNRNKVSIRQLPLFYFSLLHVLAPTGHPQVTNKSRCKNSPWKHLIVYLTWGWSVGAETCSEWWKIKKGELTYWNFVAIDGTIGTSWILAVVQCPCFCWSVWVWCQLVDASVANCEHMLCS